MFQARVGFADGWNVTNTFSSLRRSSTAPSIQLATLLLLLLTGMRSRADELTIHPAVPFARFTNAQHLFSLVLPEDWRLMDADRAKSLFEPERSGSYTNRASFGYLPPAAGTNDSATSSYIVVHVIHSRRWTPNTLAVLDHPEFRQTGALLRLRSEGVRLEDIVSTSFHPQNLVLRTDYKFTGDDGEEFKAIDCAIFTERGTAEIACVARAGDYEKLKARFDRALSSFDLHPSLRYQAGTPVAGLNTLPATKAGSQLRYIPLFALAIFCFFKWRASRVMSDEV